MNALTPESFTAASVEMSAELLAASTDDTRDDRALPEVTPEVPGGAITQDGTLTSTVLASQLSIASALLFGPVGDWVRSFELCTNLPASTALLESYRPGHAPVDGRCVFCSKPIEDCIPGSKAAKAVQRRAADLKAMQSHTISCASALAMDRAMPALLAKYPKVVETNPFSGEANLSGGRDKSQPFFAAKLGGVVTQQIIRCERAGTQLSCTLPF